MKKCFERDPLSVRKKHQNVLHAGAPLGGLTESPAAETKDLSSHRFFPFQFRDTDFALQNAYRDPKFMEKGKGVRGKGKTPFFKKGFPLSPASSLPFTLIELLVVIAIIAVLAGMLLPALTSTKESGRRSLCHSNMKNISVCYASYIAANDDWQLPKRQYGSDSRLSQDNSSHYLMDWYQALALESPETKKVTGNNELSKTRSLPLWLRCPSGDCGGDALIKNGMAYTNCVSYRIMNSPCIATYYVGNMIYVYANLKYMPLMKMSRMPRPATLGSVIDGDFPGGSKYYIPGSGAMASDAYTTFFTNGNPNTAGRNLGDFLGFLRRDLMTGRHGSANVSLFLDGHAETRPARNFAQDYYVNRNANPKKGAFVRTGNLSDG